MATAIARVILNSLKRNIAGIYGMMDVEHINVLTKQPLTRLGGASLTPSEMHSIVGVSESLGISHIHGICVQGKIVIRHRI